MDPITIGLIGLAARKLFEWYTQKAPLNFEAETETDEEGVSVKVRFTSPLPEDARLAAYVMTAKREFVKGSDAFKDHSGDFISSGRLRNGAGRLYLPFGAIRNTAAGTHVLKLVAYRRGADGEDALLGVVELNLPLQSCEGRFEMSYMRPLVYLPLLVACSDGELNRQEMHEIRRSIINPFRLSKVEDEELRNYMKVARWALYAKDVEAIVERIRRRFPELSTSAYLEHLANVAKCDGDVTPEKAEIIHRIAVALGKPEAEWPALSKSLGLNVTDLWSVFGLHRGATVEELKAAFRRLIKQYHPDCVAGFAQEWRDLAAKKTIELTEAYKSLLARFNQGAY